MKILKDRLLEATPADGSGGPAPATSNDGGDSSSFDFAALATHEESHGSEDEDIGAAAATPPAESVSPPATPPASTPAPAVPAAAAPTPAPAAAAAPPPAAPAAPATPAAAPAAPSEPVNFEQHRAKFIPELKKLYALSDEEAAQFQANPSESIPDLAAKLHYEVQLSTFNAVMSQLPQLMSSFMETQKATQQAEDAFYGQWTALKDPKYTPTVINTIKAVKAANPQMSQEELMKQAGLVAMISLGLPISPPGDSTPAAPAAPPVRVNPSRPAGIGAAASMVPRGAQPAASGNIFADIVDAYEAGDL